MGLLDRLRGKKEVEETEKISTGEETEKISTELEELFGGNQEVRDALVTTMFLDPRKIEVSMSEAAKKAKKLEDDEDYVRARVWYEIAGGLAIYKGDVEKVKEYFGRSQKISPDRKYPILKNAKATVAKAQEYYKKHLKD